jgi:hypothetical protein
MACRAWSRASFACHSSAWLRRISSAVRSASFMPEAGTHEIRLSFFSIQNVIQASLLAPGATVAPAWPLRHDGGSALRKSGGTQAMNAREAARVRSTLHTLVGALPDEDLLPILSMLSDYIARARDDADRAVALRVSLRSL